MIDFDEMKRSIRRRFEFIEFQLSWAGRIQRKQLQNQFSISSQQATVDLGEYQDSFPENLRYDPRQKAYVPGRNYQPQLTSGEVDEYLMHLERLLSSHRDADEIWPATIPNADMVSASSRAIKPSGFRMVLNAIESSRPLQVRYVSLSSPDRGVRLILPTAIASDGHRWHARAYDFLSERYSDFVLSRLDPRGFDEAATFEPPKDHAWEEFVGVKLKADASLSEPKREQLASEYKMRKGVAAIKVRRAMLYYYLRFYGFNPDDRDDGVMRNKSSFHLQIDNLEEVEVWLDRRT
jgi:hypothetical protein